MTTVEEAIRRATKLAKGRAMSSRSRAIEGLV
jgi:hypothetical protein